ncbi:hypothetical protein RN053_20935 [Pantoea dispersa]|uniref:hypothetical protein n=1 Tax=Pantoea dispersa TaxID=59814 RepID=UPI0028DE8A1D|nr:hypothetical protein [Pantoea dispersa]MDT8852978.1 hypothetical protein [Pantoea dispersa]
MKIVSGIIFLSFIVWLSACYGKNVPFSNQWPLYEALRTTASIIFAVVGAWFAIIYPERLKKSFRGGAVSEGNNGVMRLFTPIVHSTAILSSVLIIGVLAPIFKQFDFIIHHKEVFRAVSYAALLMLTFWQLITVLYSLIGPDMLKRHASLQERSRQAAESIMPKDKSDSSKP